MNARVPPPAPGAGRAVQMHARATPGFEARLQLTRSLLQHAALRHSRRVVLLTSLGAEDMVLTDLIARERLPIALATLDTGRLHAETLELVPAIEARYGIAIERHAPDPHAVLLYLQQHGAMAMRESVALRKRCCAIRKLEPMARALQGRSAWITGLRREQSDARAHVLASASDDQGREKLAPLVDWSWADVWHYIAQHEVPYNTLHDRFFPSIGCEPCTRAVALGEDLRAGRWWWETTEATKECGLHTSPAGPQP